ncbi:hypothetical protein BGX21_000592 [Mortierella sp. AD011]|nr:hypothetical protein BGX20_010717 [Mortierella sp. AD010]KAF9401798.1 hypothetical protein BGX21_000592 [Mortierella sp. AD011]
MTRYETQEPRIRSSSITAAWSYIWRGSKTHQNQHLNGNPSTPSTNKYQTITEDDDEDRVLGKGIARKVLPQQRRSTPSTQSSPAGSSRTSPRLEPSTAPDQQHQRQHQSLHPSTLERIAIHNSNINIALASTLHHSMSLPPLATIDDFKDSIFSDGISPLSVQDNRPHYHTQLRQQQQQQQQHRLQPRPHSIHGRQLNVEGSYMLGTSVASTIGTASTSIARDSRGSESADSTAQSNTTGAHRSSSPASCCSVSSISCPSPPSDKDNIPKKHSKPTRGLSSSSSSSSPPPTVGLGLVGVHGSQEPSDVLSQFATPVSGPSYFDITPSSSQAVTMSASTKKSSGFTTKTPGRRTKRTSAHSISSTITNSGIPAPRRVSCADTASQNSATFIDDQDVEIDENSFYIHLQKMQERFQAQQEPGWLRTQHAILHAKHRLPGSGSPQPDQRSSFGNVICVPRERTLGGLVFHKTFVDTHILTPSPYYQAQYLTLDHKVVEIDRDYVREISGFSHPRSVQILGEEMVYNGASKKPTRVLILERPLEGDGIVQARAIEGPMMPNLRQFTSDLAFIESFPELSRALRDFNNLCQEFENTYVYIRGFAAHTLEKLRLIYEKAYRDCVGDSVKLQKILNRGVQAEQDCFAELMENIVLGKLYQKLFIHSLMPCYAERDVHLDDIIAKYHRYLFGVGSHRGIDGGACLAATDNPLLQEALKKLGLSEKWRNMRVDHALDGAAGLFRAWDRGDQDDSSPLSLSSQRIAAANLLQESEQERKRRQLRESLRVFVQDDKYKSGKQSLNFDPESREDENETSNEDEDEEEEEEEKAQDDLTANAVWNTPLEKAYCIKLVLDKIATVAEDHLVNGQGFGFVQKKRSQVSVTTDDFIPLLAIVIIQAKMMHLGSNMFYVQKFRISTPKPDLSFALVTFEATIEFLKKDPLGLLGTGQHTMSSSTSLGSGSRTSLHGSQSLLEGDKMSFSEEVQALPWGTPSQTGWGFSPPRASSETHSLDQPNPERSIHATLSESSPARPPFAIRPNDSSQQDQQRHVRSTSVNFDDRVRRVAQAEEAGSGSSNNSSWSRSPMLGPRFTSGANSPLALASPTYGILSSSTESGSGPTARRPSHQLTHMPQRHSISNGQAHMIVHAQHNHYQNRISLDQGRDSIGRSTLKPLPSPSLTPQLVVKPQIMLPPPPKTPPMSGQNTTGRARPMSMIAAGALASSGYSSSYGGSGAITSRRSFSSNQSSPATSPRLGPGIGSRQSNSRSNSLMSGPFPMVRANSMSTVITADELSEDVDVMLKDTEQAESSSPVSPMSPWAQATMQPLPQSPLLSNSPTPMESSALTELPAGLAVPQTPEGPKLSSNRSGATTPGRIRVSPSMTLSSISTPTTPSTFSSASGSALLESLNSNSQLASPSTSVSIATPASLVAGLSAIKLPPGHETATDPHSSTSLSAQGNVRPESNADEQTSARRHLPRLSLSLSHSSSAPSTAFCKTTVTAAATHATTSVDDLEPTSTVLATDPYGAPATSATPPTSSSATASGRSSINHDGRSSSGARMKETSALHQKADSGKYTGYQSGSASHSSNHSTSSSKSYNSVGNNVIEHFSHGTALDFEQGFRDDLSLDPRNSDRRRGSATSLRDAKSIGSFQPEKVIMIWNQNPTGSFVDGHNGGGGGGQRVGAASSKRITISGGDLLSSSHSSSSPYNYQRPFSPIASSFTIEDPQQRTREMMGDFLSELAKVEDGDVLVGNGRDGVMTRQ